VGEVIAKILKQDRESQTYLVTLRKEASIFFRFFKVLQFLLFSGNVIGTGKDKRG